ncbi:Septin-6 isoform X2 [Oopsacas minuta]|uniref:Septin n=1 Tax=Oopsacas minuta TaxID=111878 RepID=A0AAV7KGR2_9METZ|nr:Septin-6 isoform X2 [Oopsacas minuta]
MSNGVEVRRVLGETDRQLRLSGKVGFDSLPDQMVTKSTMKGFDFNIMCIGETGIGKSTLIDALFKTNFEGEQTHHKMDRVGINSNTYQLMESNVKLTLTVVDSVGYGDQINKENSYQPLVGYIDTHYEKYLQEELKINRNIQNYHDTRIHVCLYFLSPTGHSIKSLDLVTMKALDKKVNIIPIIAKADSISRDELDQFKERINRELINNNVEIYRFPVDDDTIMQVNSTMNEQMPFAVVGSREEIVINNQKVRAREYAWGVVEVENEAHCDFVKLREMLIRTNMEDLRERTHTVHYELYRREQLQRMGSKEIAEPIRGNVKDMYEMKRQQYKLELEKKEQRLKTNFISKVKQKETELVSAENNLQEEFEKLRRMHAEERKELEEKRRQLDSEMADFTKIRASYQATRAQTDKANKAKKN